MIFQGKLVFAEVEEDNRLFLPRDRNFSVGYIQLIIFHEQTNFIAPIQPGITKTLNSS